MVTRICVNIGSADGLVPLGTKQFTEPMLTNPQWGDSLESNFTENVQDICPWQEFENYTFNITVASPRGQWVKAYLTEAESCTGKFFKELNYNWFRIWLVSWWVPSHNLIQYWLNGNWTLGNKFQWKISERKMHLKLSSMTCQPFCFTLNMLTHCGLVMPYSNTVCKWVYIGSGSAIRQQAITWANVDPDQCLPMPSPGHNELNTI